MLFFFCFWLQRLKLPVCFLVLTSSVALARSTLSLAQPLLAVADGSVSVEQLATADILCVSAMGLGFSFSPVEERRGSHQYLFLLAQCSLSPGLGRL